jgi:hypothetical protein
MAMLGLIAAVVVPVSLSGGADRSLVRPSSLPAETTESVPAWSTTGASTGVDGEYKPSEADTAAVVDKARRYLEAINAGEEKLADSLTCGGASLVVMSAAGTLTLSGDVEWTYSGDAAFVPYLVDGRRAEAPLVFRRDPEKGFCPTL